MSDIAIPNTLIPRTPENISDVQENFDRIAAWATGGIGADNLAADAVGTSELQDDAVTAAELADGSVGDNHIAATAGVFAAYRTLDTQATLTNTVAAADYFFGAGGSLIRETVDGGAPALLYLDDADYTIAGRTPKLRVRAQCATNATAPAITIATGLYPVSSVAGGAGVNQATLGAVLSGSQVTFTTPTASTPNQGNSGDFAFPADGYYVLGVTFSGALAANAALGLTAQLQLRWV